MVIYSDVTETECVKVRHPDLTAKIRIVRDYAAISTISEFLLVL